MKREQLIKDWKEKSVSIAEAITNRDYKTAKAIAGECVSLLEGMEYIDDHMSEDLPNFGVLCHLVNENIDRLVKDEPEFVNEWVQVIKEDAALKNKFKFYQGLRKYNGTADTGKFINELHSFFNEGMSDKAVAEGMSKLVTLFHKYEVVLENNLSKEEAAFYNACEYLLENTASSDNVSDFISSKHIIAEHLQAKAVLDSIEKDSRTFDASVASMNEAEKRVMSMLTGSDEDKKAVFEDYKNECMALINEALSKAESDEDKEKLNGILESVSGRQFDKDTFIKGMVSFIDVKEILKN